MKNILSKILYGFLFGIGLIAAGVSAYYVIEMINNASIYESDQAYVYKYFDEDSGLKIINEGSRIDDGEIAFLGTLKNEGTDSWSSIRVEVEVFDEEGNFYDECSDVIEEEIDPSKHENFKIICGGCNRKPIPEKYSVKAIIKSADHVRKEI